MSYRVPFVDPREHYRRLKTEVDFAITDTLAKGDLVLRQQLRDFEQHLAEFVGTKYAVGVNSCYHALHFSLLASGVGPGDEVITVAHTFVATVSAIVHAGAKPVLVDVRENYNMDPAAFEAAITSRTKAVIPVHLNGRVCEMDRIMAVGSRRGFCRQTGRFLWPCRLLQFLSVQGSGRARRRRSGHHRRPRSSQICDPCTIQWRRPANGRISPPRVHRPAG